MTSHSDPQLRPSTVLDVFGNQQVHVAGDVVEIATHTWAIHALIPVDGEVIMAEFETLQAARDVLMQLAERFADEA